jgi:hypothetical protein
MADVVIENTDNDTSVTNFIVVEMDLVLRIMDL